jgi:anti-sigma factor ChrR (cupin superfamily)
MERKGSVLRIQDSRCDPLREVSQMKELWVNLAGVPRERIEGHPEGTRRKVLRRSEEGEPKAFVLELAPGFEMDEHGHVHVENHFVLEGEYESGGKTHAAGTYHWIPAHTTHGPFRSPKGARILVIWED